MPTIMAFSAAWLINEAKVPRCQITLTTINVTTEIIAAINGEKTPI